MGNGAMGSDNNGHYGIPMEGRPLKRSFILPGELPKVPVNRKQRRAKAALERKKRGK